MKEVRALTIIEIGKHARMEGPRSIRVIRFWFCTMGRKLTCFTEQGQWEVTASPSEIIP